MGAVAATKVVSERLLRFVLAAGIGIAFWGVDVCENKYLSSVVKVQTFKTYIVICDSEMWVLTGR